MERVVVESPFMGKGETQEERDRQTYRNMQYLRACMADCFQHDEAPYASHGLYTQPGVLDDNVPAERKLGINAGFLWGEAASARKFYIDFGMSTGMHYGMEEAKRLDQRIDAVKLGPGWEELDTGVVVSPALAAELRHHFELQKRTVEIDGEIAGHHIDKEDHLWMDGYQKGLAAAQNIVSGGIKKE